MLKSLIYTAKIIRTKFVSDHAYLKKRFIKKLGYCPNFKTPQSFNEKVSARMLFERNSLHTKLADKFAVRDLVASKIGATYLVPLIGTYKCFDEIDFDQLPQKFVLKCSHDSGSAIVCKDKNKFKKEKIRCKLKTHLKMNMYYRKREWHYKNILPRILAEQYIDLYADISKKLTITTCRVHCFEGQSLFIEVDITDHKNNDYSNIYNTSWVLQPFKVDQKENTSIDLDAPKQLDKMIQLSEKLCFKYGYSRIDFLLSQDEVFFSEITLTPNAGRMVITPQEWDLKLGTFWLS